MSRSSLHRPLSLRAQALALLSRREHSRLELRRKLLEHGRKRLAAGWPVDSAAAEDAEQAPAIATPDATEATPHRLAGVFRASALLTHPPPVVRQATTLTGTQAGTQPAPLPRSLTSPCATRPQADPPEPPQTCPPSSHDDATEIDTTALAAAVDAVLDWLQTQHHLSDSRFVESRIHSRASRHGHARIRQELAQHGLELDDQADRQLRDTELERAREVWRRRFGGQVAGSPSERAKQLRFLAGRGFAAEVAYRIVGGRDEDD